MSRSRSRSRSAPTRASANIGDLKHRAIKRPRAQSKRNKGKQYIESSEEEIQNPEAEVDQALNDGVDGEGLETRGGERYHLRAISKTSRR